MKIGEIKEASNGKKYKCVISPCKKGEDCAKYCEAECELYELGYCGAPSREDGNNVIFIEVKE